MCDKQSELSSWVHFYSFFFVNLKLVILRLNVFLVVLIVAVNSAVFTNIGK